MTDILISGVYFVLENKKVEASQNDVAVETKDLKADYTPPQKLATPPQVVKAVYVTGYSAGTKKYLNYLSNLFKNTEINSVVLDIKGSDGYVSYESGASDVKKYDLYSGAIRDIDSLVNFLHENNIYLIGRIAVFEDPVYSKARPELAIYKEKETTDLKNPVLWKDNNGMSWLDPASKDAWDYNISLAKDALYHGFDEINFDYIRFPSDGSEDNMGFPAWDTKTKKINIMKDFYAYLRNNLPGEKISADLFGQTTINKDGMGIGQLLENALASFDHVSPMIYPSHYIDGFDGFNNPAEHPYEIVKDSLDSALKRQNNLYTTLESLAVEKAKKEAKPTAGLIEATVPITDMPVLAKIRPWLQDFNMGAEYTTDMVKQEIKATQDALGDNYKGFMLWNPSNIYTQEAIKNPS